MLLPLYTTAQNAQRLTEKKRCYEYFASTAEKYGRSSLWQTEWRDDGGTRQERRSTGGRRIEDY